MSARQERTQASGQSRALIVTGPDELRARFAGHTPAALVEAIAALRPRPGDVARLRDPGRAASWAAVPSFSAISRSGWMS